MSSEPTSRVNPDPVTTLADVVAAVQIADLPKQRQQEIGAALRTAARAIGKPLERVPAEPRRLQALLSEVSPIALGLSPGRWANVRSLIRAGLALVQPMMPGRHITPLSPGWKTLWQQLPRKIRRPLSRFARFCSVRGIEPEGVTDAVIEAFHAYLADSLLKSPDKIFAAMARAWRAAQTTVDGWPQIAITIPNRRRDWTLPWSHFPASLQRDCASLVRSVGRLRSAGRGTSPDRAARHCCPSRAPDPHFCFSLGIARARPRDAYLITRSCRDRRPQNRIDVSDRAQRRQDDDRDL